MDTKATVNKFVDTWLSEDSFKDGWVSKIQASMSQDEQALVNDLAQIVEDEFIFGAEKKALKSKYADAWDRGDFESLINKGDQAWQRWKLETLFTLENETIGSFFKEEKSDAATVVAENETASESDPLNVLRDKQKKFLDEMKESKAKKDSLPSPEQKREADKKIAGSTGLLSDLKSMTDLPLFGDGGLDSAVSNAVGGLIGKPDTQYGSGGLGSLGSGFSGGGNSVERGGLGTRGSGFSGGGTAAGLGGLGTRGSGLGATGYGRGAGFYGQKSRGAPGVGSGDPIILGAIDKSTVERIVNQYLPQIKYCYEKELSKNPHLFGKVVVKFVIDKDGSVSSAITKATTLNNATVETCICERFKKMKFPAPKGGGIGIVSYPFVFAME